MILESCCTSLEAALSAQARGTDRIELCTDLSVGGITPPRDLIAAVVKALTIPVNVLIRPSTRESSEARRFGRQVQSASRVEVNDFSYRSFVYGEAEIEQMVADIGYCQEVGAAGIVVGALMPDGSIDVATMQRLMAAARPLPVTFHRAFDVCTQDPTEALETVISLGCTRLLTSGMAENAWEGREQIARLVQQAGDRLILLVGRGVNAQNVKSLATVTGAREFHGTQLP